MAVKISPTRMCMNGARWGGRQPLRAMLEGFRSDSDASRGPNAPAQPSWRICCNAEVWFVVVAVWAVRGLVV